MRRILYDRKGVSLPSVLVALVVISAVSLVSVPSFLGKTDGAENGRAKMSVLEALRVSKVEFMYGGDRYPSSASLIEALENRFPEKTYVAYSPSSPSVNADMVTIDRESDIQISVCARSKTGLVYCGRDNAMGRLTEGPSVAFKDSEGRGLLEWFGPAVAHAANSEEDSKVRSVCVGWSEDRTRDCLATSTDPARESSDTSSDWSRKPGDVVSEPEPESEPEEPELEDFNYQDAVNSLGPDAECPFDEQGTEYVNLQCRNINGQLQDRSPVFTTQKDGAILSDPSSKAIGFQGSTHYSYGNPQNGATNNQGQNWSFTVWTRSNVDAPNAGIISADDNWAAKAVGASGFACAMRLGNPWDVREIKGGPPMEKNRWYMIACTYDQGTFKLYVNGYQVAASAGVPIGQSGNGNFRPGYMAGGWSSGYLNGDLDQFNFFKKTLEAEDISELYRQAGY